MDLAFEIAWLSMFYIAAGIIVLRLTIWQVEPNPWDTAWFLTLYIPTFIIVYTYTMINLWLRPEAYDDYGLYTDDGNGGLYIVGSESL